MKMRNQVRTIVLLGLLSTVLVVTGGSLGGGWLLGSIVFAVALNLGAWLFSDRIVLRSTGAQEVGPAEAPRLHQLVAELAGRAELPMPKVAIVPSDEPNAFATGRSPDRAVVAVSTGLLRVLDERELRGVIAHELAHVKNRDTLVATIAAMMGSAISGVAQVVQFGALFGGHSDDEEQGQGGGLLFALLAPIAATLVQLGISRQREYLADATGAAIAGDADGLASALQKIEAVGRWRAESGEPAEAHPATVALGIASPVVGGGLARWFSTHPPVAERVARLRRLDPATFARAA